jgi:hypothetical protein
MTKETAGGSKKVGKRNSLLIKKKISSLLSLKL